MGNKRKTGNESDNEGKREIKKLKRYVGNDLRFDVQMEAFPHTGLD